MVRTIGVLTGGGDCPGLNAVIRAVVKAASADHQLRVVGILDGYAGLVEGRARPLTDADVSGILPRGGTILGTSNRDDPFRYATPNPDGSTAVTDRSDDALRQIERLGIEGLVIIGGDGTLSIAQKLSVRGVPIVGVPKTIDNDLAATDVTFGFDSALAVATDAVDRLHTTAESHHRVMVLEVMGRYAGWIALRAGIAGGGDIILIPEIPYDAHNVCHAARKRLERGKRFSIVVVAEGAAPVGGKMVVQRAVAGSPDPIRLGGVGQAIAQHVEPCAGLESRVTVLGHLQRGGSPTPFDRWLATRFGVAAVELLIEGRAGRMVCLKGQRIESVELSAAVSQLRRVAPTGDEVQVARAVGTSFGD
ncbi:MAG: 6-phosphofructokinase [Candidatus Omnitrophica bacterium]|nr:6-phosphofructokinase [Candidatus Omnitrophota bacterium]